MKVVVIPAHNEAETIEGLVVEALKHSNVVVVADDASTDATAELARRAGARVVAVPRDRRGIVGVYRCGLSAAIAMGATLVVEMDAGGSHDPKLLPSFFTALEHHGVAYGSRNLGLRYRVNWKRRFLSWLGVKALRWFHGLDFTDATSGYVGYRARVLKELLSSEFLSEGHFYQTEVRLRLAALRVRHTELPISYESSSSSLNWKSIVEAAKLVMRDW